jgi:transcriptional regulator with XRE-family HTH domain
MKGDHPNGAQSRHTGVKRPKADLLQFGRQVCEARLKLDWTQAKLAEVSGLHWNSVGSLERGQRDNLDSRWRVREAIDAEHQRRFGRSFSWLEGQVDKETLLRYLQESEVVDRIDKAVIAASDVGLVPADSFVGTYLERIFRLEIRTLPELDSRLREDERGVTAFAICCFEDQYLRLGFVPQGLGVAILFVFHVLKRGAVRELTEFLLHHSLDKKKDPEKTARALKSAYEKALKLAERKW